MSALLAPILAEASMLDYFFKMVAVLFGAIAGAIGGMVVPAALYTLVNLGGPFAGGKTIMRENYRMLGAIIQTKDKGNYFLKLYGPKATIDENEKGFQELVKSLKVK
jgi:hypothetical protein